VWNLKSLVPSTIREGRLRRLSTGAKENKDGTKEECKSRADVNVPFGAITEAHAAHLNSAESAEEIHAYGFRSMKSPVGFEPTLPP